MDEYSWHKSPAFVVYIDQPVGTGISFTTSRKYPTNDVEVNTDFYFFLKEFLSLHKDKFLNDSNTLNRPLYFSGESHAGHYIPSMMNYIQQQNSNSPSVHIPLAGAAIGNGWIDPPVQYSAHEAAYGKGIIGLAQKRAMEETEKICQQHLANGKYVSGVCFSLLDDIVDNSQGSGSSYKISQYDARKTERIGAKRDFPPGHKDVEAYLGGSGKQSFAGNFKQVLEAIHSMPSREAGQEYEECTDPPYNALKHQDGLGVTQDVVDLLNNNVRLLFFNGIEDMICNHVGNEIAVENFNWTSQNKYQIATRYGWKAPSTNKLAGYMKEYENLMYLKVKDSGHMVPMDVPSVALDMMRALIYEKSFDDYEQHIASQGKGDKSDDDHGSNCPVCPARFGDDDDDEACPKCPTCPNAGANSKNPEDWEEWAEKTPAVLVGVGVVTTWLVTLCTYWICAKRSKGTPVQQYDMEMTGGSGYTDQLDLEDEEDEDIVFS
jgi:carboxypeptidase D